MKSAIAFVGEVETYIVELAHALEGNASIVESMHIALLMLQDFRVILDGLPVHVQLSISVGPIVVGFNYTHRAYFQLI